LIEVEGRRQGGGILRGGLGHVKTPRLSLTGTQFASSVIGLGGRPARGAPHSANDDEGFLVSALLTFSEGLRRLLETIARTSGWLLVVMAAVTCFDVLARKTGIPAPLTKLQELEWHFHAALFSLWMGYGYTINAHPRVDSFTEKLAFRKRAWLELVGCLVFALPYCALVAYHSLGFVASSYALAEQSDSTVGLRYRWLIKGIYAAGLWLVVLGILSVLARLIVYLFSDRLRDRVDLQIGHTELEV
jgi:TRAP-type mannitol/chloroaromatic compound transport system permease small subunit